MGGSEMGLSMDVSGSFLWSSAGLGYGKSGMAQGSIS